MNDTPSASRPAKPLVVGLVVTVIAAAAIVTLLAIMLLGRNQNGLAGDSSPTATVDASPTGPPASVVPSTASTATPEPTPEPLDVDSIAAVMVDDLNLREEAATDARSLGHFFTGGYAFVVDGPVEAEGFVWYQVVPMDQRFEEGTCDYCGAAIGWVAAVSDGGDRWLEPADVSCPDKPSFDELPDDKFQRLACYGSQTLELEGVVHSPCCGYVGYYDFKPVWLANPTANWYLGDFSLPLRFPPDHEWPEIEYSDIVNLTGHFDDPAAGDCTVVVNANAGFNGVGSVDPQVAARAPVDCRTQFVVETIQVVGNTGEKCGC